MKDFQLPDKARKELAEIFTEEMIPAIERACVRYLFEDSKEKTSVPDDGDRLQEIGEKARELRQLLKDSKSALNRVHLHVSEEYGKHDTLLFIEDLKKELRMLDEMTFINPASEYVRDPHGRPTGTKKNAEWMLAFNLWEIYRQAHGRPASRIEDRIESSRKGPLPRAAAILRPFLNLPSDLSSFFRKIGEEYKAHVMEINSNEGEA